MAQLIALDNSFSHKLKQGERKGIFLMAEKPIEEGMSIAGWSVLLKGDYQWLLEVVNLDFAMKMSA